MKSALLYEKLKENKVRCNLCNHRCIIAEGKKGICGVRENKNGELFSLVYGKIIAEHLDPIEKKPLYHFLPGSLSYSISTVGCNFRCKFCQNFEISQYPRLYGGIAGFEILPESLVNKAVSQKAKSISYTYTEPTVYFELAYDCAKIAVEKGLRNVFVSNGYMTEETIDLIKPYLHGINVDLKSFRDEFYKNLCGARLKPVLDSLKYLKTQGIWVEVTTLIIPGENDSEEELKEIAEFIKTELGKETPWHVSRFYPTFELLNKPPTPIETLERAYEIGKETGLEFVYLGNVPGSEKENTYCPDCGKLLIERYGFYVIKNELKDEGICPGCGRRIAGIWK